MLGSFGDFLESLDADPSRRGRQFERFVQWFLKVEPEWSTQVEQVWLWDEWPGRWGPDCGIDLVFRHHNGETWAVQAKCYSRDHDITKQDVDKFLSESNRPQIHGRLLIATTDRIGPNARQVCEAQDKPVVRYLLGDFEKAEINYPASLADLPLAGRRPRPAPREHQIEAIDSVVTGFQNTQRGQLIMACGTGKTYVALWVKERLQSTCTLVLVPSLGLLSQILREWTFAAAEPFEVLCVCSDTSVGARGSDETVHSLGDLAFPVTSDAGEIRRFLSGSRSRVVFSTYQSSLLVAEAQADPDVPAFDLAIADEAHRCAGKVDSNFTAILDQATIRCDKRLFATATPRTYTSTVHKRAEERGVEVVGMDNVEQFGEVLHALPFGKAIERKLLTDYRVIIIGVDDPMIAQWITRRELVSTGTGVETDSESLAAQIGLLKAIQDYDLKRIISFHSRVTRAKDFAADITEVMAWCGDEHRPTGRLRADFVSGEMPTGKRRIKLDQLRQLAEGERAILSNARCLSEGVDVPALDGVAFIDPRSSQVDIIQAVGRAIRLSANKTAGTIILPVFIRAGEDAVGSIEASNFKPIWDVLNALKAHDDVLACELDEIRTDLGRRGSTEVREDALSKIHFDLPVTVAAGFPGALRSYLVERVTDSWEFWFGLLEAFVTREGHARVHHNFKTKNGYWLGKWVGHQRANHEQIEKRRRDRLDALPSWSWDVHSAKWEDGFRSLEAFATLNGHCLVPTLWMTDSKYRLGQWVLVQRCSRATLSNERMSLLESLPGWSWDVLSDKWEAGFRRLLAFCERVGHSRVLYDFKEADGYRLGKWVSHQRQAYPRLSPEQRARFEALPNWSWEVLLDQWEIGFAHLKEFVDQQGHALVPTADKSSDGYRIGLWVANQRNGKDGLSLLRRTRLEALPSWSWDATSVHWEKGFRHLKDFAEREGHVRVPADYKAPDGFSVRTWLKSQRKNLDGISQERKERLEALPGWSWDSLVSRWEDGYRDLLDFVERQGHTRVPTDYQTEDGFRLGGWVSTQRQSRVGMPVERKERLEKLPGWSWDIRTDKWEDGYRHLKAFVGNEGHAKVPGGYKAEDGYSLGNWVGTQRKIRAELPDDRKVRLEALPGWVWDVYSDKWEDGFRHLMIFVSKFGHTSIPRRFKTADGYPLGQWVFSQRKSPPSLTPEGKARLEALPDWEWVVFLDSWEE